MGHQVRDGGQLVVVHELRLPLRQVKARVGGVVDLVALERQKNSVSIQKVFFVQTVLNCSTINQRS